jgi:hypothetical protein
MCDRQEIGVITLPLDRRGRRRRWIDGDRRRRWIDREPAAVAVDRSRWRGGGESIWTGGGSLRRMRDSELMAEPTMV